MKPTKNGKKRGNWMKTLNDFLTSLFKFYPPKLSENDTFELMEHYQKTIEPDLIKDRNYDFDKLLRLVSREHKYKTPPDIPDIIEKIPYCEIIPEAKKVNIGGLIRITCKNGQYFDLTVCDNIELFLGQAKKKITELYGEIKKVETFAKGTVIIGNTIHMPDGKTYKWEA